jgi:ABC-type branched-subunit amino acid transport system ATPase component
MGEITLECRGVSKAFGGVRAVDRVSLSFEAGRVTALIGPNGAGKTTLFHLLSGQLPLDEGQIFLRQRRIDGLSNWRIARWGVGRLFQDVRLFGQLSVLDNVCVAYQGQEGENPLSALLRRSSVRQQSSRLMDRGRGLLAEIGLGGTEQARAADLSYGQQKLLALTRLLAADADVLLLDEPTAGVHPDTIIQLRHLLRRLAGAEKTIVLIEHNMTVVLEVADWVYFLDEGQVVASGLPGDVLTDRLVRAAYMGL